MAHAEVRGRRLCVILIDIALAFPSSCRKVVLLALRARGERGAMLRAIARRIRQTGMAPGLGPGTDLRRVAISLGLFEGTHGSPLYFMSLRLTRCSLTHAHSASGCASAASGSAACTSWTTLRRSPRRSAKSSRYSRWSARRGRGAGRGGWCATETQASGHAARRSHASPNPDVVD